MIVIGKIASIMVCGCVALVVSQLLPDWMNNGPWIVYGYLSCVILEG